MNQIAHAAVLLDLTFPHHHHFFSQPPSFGEIVGHEQRGNREIAAQVVERFLELRPRNRIQCPEWLVEQNDFWPSGDAPREGDTLALTAGKLVRETITELRGGKTNQLQSGARGLVHVGHLLKRRHQRDVAQHPPVWK